MKVIDIDSHSWPRTDDYLVPPDFLHLRPRIYADARGNRWCVFHNRILGEDHLFFGSDYPHTDGHLDIVDKVQGLPLLSEAQKAEILGGHANTLSATRCRRQLCHGYGSSGTRF